MKHDDAPHGRKPIRLLVVDDSPLVLAVVRHMLAKAPDIVIAGTAGNGSEALRKIRELKPDVVCTDFRMPGMDGIELTRRVMREYPLPILVMSASLQPHQRENIFAALQAGALDILAKPQETIDASGPMEHELIHKIRVLAGVRVFRSRSAAATPEPAAPAGTPSASSLRIVGIGASTGGPQALETLLRGLPRDFPLPILCVQHIAEGFTAGLVAWLAGSCRLRICMAVPGIVPEPGTAYFAGDDRHLEVDPGGRLRCSAQAPVAGHRPSIDLAFRSLAREYGAAALGILLTGMGSDGAQGLLAIRKAGGPTIAQDEQTSVVFGMPRVAIELGAAANVMPLDRIGSHLARLVAGERP